MADLAERLSDRLETRVRVQLGKRKGKVLIEFATLDDLQRICDAIGLDQRSVQLPEATGSATTGPEATEPAVAGPDATGPTGDDPQVVQERTTTPASV
jgi:hypothetical protein